MNINKLFILFTLLFTFTATAIEYKIAEKSSSNETFYHLIVTQHGGKPLTAILQLIAPHSNQITIRITGEFIDVTVNKELLHYYQQTMPVKLKQAQQSSGN